MQQKQELDLTDAEHRMLQFFAAQRGVSVDEVATQMISESLARRMLRKVRGQVARVYRLRPAS